MTRQRQCPQASLARRQRLLQTGAPYLGPHIPEARTGQGSSPTDVEANKTRNASPHSGLSFGETKCGDGIVVQGSPRDILELFTDADWSGDKATRRSVSASVLSWNGHVLATASRTQKSVFLSSCESEFGVETVSLIPQARSLCSPVRG